MGLEVDFVHFGWLLLDYLKGNQENVMFFSTLA